MSSIGGDSEAVLIKIDVDLARGCRVGSALQGPTTRRADVNVYFPSFPSRLFLFFPSLPRDENRVFHEHVCFRRCLAALLSHTHVVRYSLTFLFSRVSRLQRVSYLARPAWSATAAALMASHSAGSSRDTIDQPPVAGGASPSAAGAPVDTAHLNKLAEKALTAEKSGRHTLVAAFFRHAADEALRLHGNTFVCTFLTVRRAASLVIQAQLEGGSPEEKAALRDEGWALVSGCLPLILRRMDANTMLPGRGTAVELAFFKWYEVTRRATFDAPPLPARGQQLVGLSLGYATALEAAVLLLALLPLRTRNEVQTFVLRVVDCMQPATRSLAETSLSQELSFASTIQQALSHSFSADNAAFVASLRAKWTAAAMVQMRRERDLLDVSEKVEKVL